MSRDAWEPMSEVTPYLDSGIYVWLLYDFPAGERAVLGCHRTGRFFGRETEGWWGVEKIGEFGRRSHGMWIDGWIKGWKRYCDHVPAPPASEFQSGVDKWMDACFGEPIKSDQLERADRFTEESLELAQTMPGFTADRAHALVDYVFGRDVGERHQEVGGVMVTLAALCNTVGLDIAEEGDRELARIWTKVEKIRAKQAAKPTGSALPVTLPAAEGLDAEGLVEAVARALLAVEDSWNDHEWEQLPNSTKLLFKRNAAAALSAIRPTDAERVKWEGEVADWLRGEATTCDCFAREANECACGAWDDAKRVDPRQLADAIRSGAYRSDERG